MVFPKVLSSQSRQRTKTVGRLAVYLLLLCSAIFLFSSYQLESARFDAFIRNSVTTTSRVLPEKDQAENDMDNIGNSEFYVPSLDFRIKGISQYTSNGKLPFEAHVYCKEFEKDLLWEWWRPNDDFENGEEQRRQLRKTDSGSQVRTTKKRLLIGVTSGYDDRARLLERAVWSARVYGAIWSSEKSNGSVEDMDVTVVALQGTSFSPHGCKAPSSHSSVDKIRVLFEAIDSEARYDRLLLLDADAMVYGMDTDLTSLVDGNDDFVVMGPPVLTEDGKRDKNKPWEMSTGMTLWNLEHPLTRTIALDWFKFAKNAIIRGSYRSDQKYLHKTLQQYYSTNEDGIVKRNDDRDIDIFQILTDNVFDDDSRGTIVKQFGVRTATNGENKTRVARDNQIEERLSRMEETAREICGQYPDACKKVGAPPRYETS